MTTSDYLTQLQQDREDLVDNLETKGITGLTGDETFTELVPEVLNIETTPDTTDLRSVINMTDVNVTSQTPFNDYPQALYNGYIKVLKNKSTLMDNMPKGTSTGTITDGADIPLYELKISKLSSQEGTPSPSNPIEINTIKGYTNLFNVNSTNYVQNTETTLTGTGEDFTISSSASSGVRSYFIKKIDFKTLYRYMTTEYVNNSISLYATNNSSYNSWSSFISDRTEIVIGWENNSIDLSDYQNKYLWMQVRGANRSLGYSSVNYKNFILSTEMVSDYVPYGINYIILTITSGTNTRKVYVSLNNEEICGVNINNLDELIIDDSGQCYLNKKTGKILSYNGQAITTDYMSTTGGLDTGATVYYVLNTPQLIDLQYNVDLSLYEGTNTITNSESADMEIKYIKESYE